MAVARLLPAMGLKTAEEGIEADSGLEDWGAPWLAEKRGGKLL